MVEVCQKSTFQAELDKGHTHMDYGVKIEAELAEDNDREDELRIYVAEVRPDSLAHSKGIYCVHVCLVSLAEWNEPFLVACSLVNRPIFKCCRSRS